MICGNCLLNQLTTGRNDVDKTVEAFLVIHQRVEKFSGNKVILVFHNPVLKQPEECKILGKACCSFDQTNESVCGKLLL